jgi:lactam utilization protein B
VRDPDEQAFQALALIEGTPLRTQHGSITVGVQTLCIHGDAQNADLTAERLRRSLEMHGVRIEAYAV